MDLTNKRIIIAKTNQIGDVICALPIASALKKHEPSCKIIFMGRNITKELIEQYHDVDEFVNWDELNLTVEAATINSLKALNADVIIHVHPVKKIAQLAKQAGIPVRVGNSRRFYNWLNCNRLVKIKRKNSPLHETQQDMLYLKVFRLKHQYTLDEIIALRRFNAFTKPSNILSLIDNDRFNLILHPKTRGQHIEWPPAHFAQLIGLLPPEKFKIFVTGNEREGQQVGEEMIKPFPHVVDLTGKTSLADLLQLIAAADGLIAASTGPVHIAAVFDIHTLGLYAPIRPSHPGRWRHVGSKARVLALEQNCDGCRYTASCACVAKITPEQVLNVISEWQAKGKPKHSLIPALPEPALV